MREEFEAHAKVRWSTDYDGFGDGLFSIQADGRYEYEHIQWDWETWKASRAALRVELPEVGSAPDGAKYDLGFGDPKFAHDYREHQVSAAMRQLCREALQQAGIEVAE
ncbi:hypothetical protein ACIUX8_06120 [Pseudomonas aeruginosa]